MATTKEDRLFAVARDALDVICCLQVAFPDTVGKLALRESIDALRRVLREYPPVIHVLYHGRSLCELGAPPDTWPDNEKWVGVDNWDLADCARCKDKGGI